MSKPKKKGGIFSQIEKLKSKQLRLFLQEVGDPQIIDHIHSILEIRKQRKRKKKATSSLLDFIKYTKSDYQVNWHHKIICDTLDEFMDPNSGLDRPIIELPPRCGKSEIHQTFSSILLGKYPDNKIIVAAYGMSLAKKFLKGCPAYYRQ